MTTPTSTSLLPPLRTPPHDPLSLLLGGRLGWPGVAETPSLELPADPAARRPLGEPHGSLGGRALPSAVAVDDDGRVWLVDPSTGRLLLFDDCDCAFVTVPGIGGPGTGPGHLDRPRAIAARAGHLFVCDTGNHRVQVLLTPDLMISAVWDGVPGWEPVAVAVDDRFRVHVLDAATHVVHRFGWSGRHLGQTDALGDATTLALTRGGGLVVAGPTTAFLVEGGRTTPLDLDEPGDLELPEPPFAVSATGALHLGPCCRPPGDGWFGTHGEPVPPPPTPARLFVGEQTRIVGPLDSLLDDCVWDRVVLTGDVPEATGIAVDSFTAQVELTPEEVAALPEEAWATRQVCRSGAEWDALLRSIGGRYLWLRLRLFGDGRATPRLDEMVVEFPRIGLRRHLPAVYGAEPVSADFTDRLLALVHRVLRDVEEQIDDVPAELDPHATRHLDRLAGWIGMRPDPRLPEKLRRDLVAGAGRLTEDRGTPHGLHGLLVLALGLTRPSSGDGGCTHTRGRCAPCAPPRETCPPTPPADDGWQPPPLILEHYRLRRWFESGASTLGDTTTLWGDSIVNRSQLGESARVAGARSTGTQLKGTQDPAHDPFHVYAHRFTVFAPGSAGRTEERRRALAGLVRWATPAHAEGDVRYVEPRMRIGVQSSIGLDSVVARLPHGVTLGETPLGPASVLVGGPADRPAISSRPSIAVGTTAVLG